MNEPDNWIIIGCFGRPHGIKGFVTVNSFTEPKDTILNYDPWYAFINNSWQIVKLISPVINSKTIITQVEGFPERENVALLTNVKIAISKDQLKQLNKDEFYWYQLIGMHVINLQGINLGKVNEIIPTGSNDVLVVQGKKRHLIPYLPGQFVMQVNCKEHMITVDWDQDF